MKTSRIIIGLVVTLMTYESGNALKKCLVCRGSKYYCEVGETGESEDCGGPVRNRVCFEMEGKDGTDEQHIKRAGCVNLEDAKRMAKKFGVVLVVVVAVVGGGRGCG